MRTLSCVFLKNLDHHPAILLTELLAHMPRVSRAVCTPDHISAQLHVRFFGTFQIPIDSLLTQTQRYTRLRQTHCSLLLPSREKCRFSYPLCFSYPPERQLAAQAHKVGAFPLHTAPSASSWVERTPHTSATALQHVCVDHRRVDVLMAQEFLDRADIIPILQQMGGKGVPERISTLLIIRR